MENLNMYEEQPVVANPVTMDALGNTNQDIFNHYGDFNNQLISDVALGKSTEITDMVMQQQPENAFCNISDTLNTINNNKFNGGHDENNFMDEGEEAAASPLPEEPSAVVSNDDNNNSNDNFGPETDVDAIDDDFQLNVAMGGDKERTQMELKETEDVADRIEAIANEFGDAMFGTLENKIFDQLSLQHPDLKGNNPFAPEADVGFVTEAVSAVDEFMDNKMMEQVDELTEKLDNFEQQNEFEAFEGGNEVAMSANDEEIAVQQEQPQADLGFVGGAQQVGESGGEESEDEWNYIKVDKKSSEGLEAVSEEVSEIPESPVQEDREEIEENKENLSQVSDNENQVEQAFEPETPQQFVAENFSDHFEAHQEPQESPLSETVKDFEQEKEEPEERHAQDAVEKDLQLTIETEDFDDMSTQLNPDAKEFVPISPMRNNGMMSPPLNPMLNQLTIEDAVVSQSPRKGEFQPMEDVTIPSELDFDIEANERPHEVNSVETPETLNLKESMQQDDKLEQEYTDEAQVFVEEVSQQSGEEYPVLEKSFNEYSNGFQSHIDDAMNRSFYEGRDDGDILTTAGDVLNSVQPIPTFEDEQHEGDVQKFETENDKPEADLASSHEWGLSTEAPVAMDGSDFNFEAEKFVEEIKSANTGAFDKYVDQELSPTIPEFTTNTIQNVEETIFVTNEPMEPIKDSNLDTFIIDTSSVSNIEAPKSPVEEEIEVPVDVQEVQQPAVEPEPVLELQEIRETVAEQAIHEPVVEPEIQEPVVEPEIQEPAPTPSFEVEQPVVIPEISAEVVSEEPKVEAEIVAVAAAAVAGAAVAATTAAKKAPSKPDVKKTEVKKAPVAAKATSTVAKKAPATTAAKAPTKAPVAAATKAAPPKASSAPIRKAPAAAPVTKLATSSATARPKPATTVPAVKKTTSTTSAAPAPKPAAPRTTTLAAKKPASAVTAAKPPATRPATTAAAPKPRPAVSAPTERKVPAATTTTSRVAAARAAAPAKPKTNGVSTAAKTTITKTTTITSTLSPRPASSPLNKSVPSPSAPAKTPSSRLTLSAKKPTTATAASPAAKKTSTATPLKKTGTTPSSVKKTTISATKTTTTKTTQKVVNGDVIAEEVTTTTTVTGNGDLIEDLSHQLNGTHINGNGIAENGTGEGVQMVLDSQAD